MPTYRFRKIKSGKEFTEFMKISELDPFIANYPEPIEQLVNGAPALGDSVRLGVTRSPDSWNSLLKEIKSKHRHSTIKTR